MACSVRTHSDGSWRCTACQKAGDRDEDPDDTCPDRRAPDAEKNSQPAKRG